MSEKTEQLAVFLLMSPGLQKREAFLKGRQEGQEAAEKGSRVTRGKASYS